LEENNIPSVLHIDDDENFLDMFYYMFKKELNVTY